MIQKSSNPGVKRVAILGSTGSIGRQALEVIALMPNVQVCGLSAGGNWQLLAEQVRQFQSPVAAMADESAAGELRAALDNPAACHGVDQRSPGEVLSGPVAMAELVRRTRPDMLLSGVVGAAGLAPTLAAIEVGADLAIANKETLVMAGAIVMPAARKAGVKILPIDSEHSAIFQCLQGSRADEVARVVITASGGALRDWPEDAIENATVADALAHPTWRMGRKITIDSATLMNKALEIIEAHWLFDLPPEQIDVVVHPESIIHSYVEFRDGSVIAQMGRPDMKTPIAYALSYPRRESRAVPPLDLAAVGRLTFRPPSATFRRAIDLGYQAIRRRGACGAVLNAANEVAVEAFLAGRISFGRIVRLVEEVVARFTSDGEVTLDGLLSADAWAREQVVQTIARDKT